MQRTMKSILLSALGVALVLAWSLTQISPSLAQHGGGRGSGGASRGAAMSRAHGMPQGAAMSRAGTVARTHGSSPTAASHRTPSFIRAGAVARASAMARAHSVARAGATPRSGTISGARSAARIAAPPRAGSISRSPISHGSFSHGPISHGPISHGPISHGTVSHGTVSRGPISHGRSSITHGGSFPHAGSLTSPGITHGGRPFTSPKAIHGSPHFTSPRVTHGSRHFASPHRKTHSHFYFGPYGYGYGHYGHGLGISVGVPVYRNYNYYYNEPYYSAPYYRGYAVPYVAPSTVAVPSYTAPPTSTYGAVIPAAGGAARFQLEAEQAFRQQRYEDAARLSNHALVEDPRNGKLHLFASQTLFALGDYRAAAAALHQAASLLDRGQWGFVVENYKKFYTGDDYVTQMSSLVEFTKQNADASYAYFLRGYHYKFLGYDEAARKLLTQAVELGPRDRLAVELLVMAGGAAPPDSPPNAQPAEPQAAAKENPAAASNDKQ